MKRQLSLLLAAVMLCSALLLFSSCAKGEVKTKGKTAVDLSEYTVIYAEQNDYGAVSTTYKDWVNDFCSTASTLSGRSLRVMGESHATGGVDTPKILIGATNFSESTKARDSIKGHGFVIEVKDDCIVIVGTNGLFTILALQYFKENYLKKECFEGSTLTLNKRAKLQRAETVTMAAGEEFYFSFVRSNTLDTDPKNEYGDVTIGTGCDYTYDLYLALQQTVSKASGVPARDVERNNRLDTSEPSEHEFIVGQADRDVVRECLAELAGDEFGIFVRDGHVVVTAWGDAALQKSAATVHGYFYESYCLSEDGVGEMVLPATMKITGRAGEDRITDFPKPTGEGIELFRTAYSEDRSLIYVYMGDGVNATACADYLSVLKEEGYVIVSDDTIEKSRFALLKNESTGVSLYIAYNAFAHADISGTHYPYEQPTLRIVSSPLDAVTLPDAALLSPQSYDKVTDSAITAVALPSGQIGTGYVMLLEDGRFLVMDGGGGTGAKLIWDIMSDLYTKYHGHAPKAGEPVKIAAWIISHGHSDHYHALRYFAEEYGKSAPVELEYVIANLPAREYMYNTGEIEFWFNENIEKMQKQFASSFTYLRVHTGQKLYFANAELEILYTPEDMVPHRIVTGNDASVIMRISLQASENGQKRGEAVSFMWTGDAFRYSGMWVSAMFGDHIKSDMVAAAHHLGPGLETLFYQLVEPEVIWVPQLRSSYESYWSKGENWYNKVDRYLVEDPSSADYVIFADTTHTTVYIRANGADLTNFYAALEGVTFTAEQRPVAVTKH